MIASIHTAATSVRTAPPQPNRSVASPFADMSAGLAGGAGTLPEPRPDPRKDSAKADAADSAANLADALAAFKKEASLTPSQRARRDVIEAVSLTGDAIKAMSPELRQATELKIAAEVQRRLRQDDGPASTAIAATVSS